MISTLISSLDVIPKPSSFEPIDGFCRISASTPILIDRNAAASSAAAKLLSDAICSNKPSGDPVVIRFSSASDGMGNEGYAITITTDGVTIEATAAAGWFYAVQTLLQMLPQDTSEGSEIELPCCRIVDRPRFDWRGLMLDVSRHLMPVDGILRLLDNMAAHKLNTFHWHLMDDQGWRVESKRYPRLTKIGAWRRGADGVLTVGHEKELPHIGTYGGFYTHDDVRKIVAHAAARHIRVVPEIEMPGHAVAALAGYPELSCTGGPFEPAVRTGIFKDVYCAGSDDALAFLENVVEELLPLFPGEYVHVGGDECLKDRWKTCPKCQARIAAEKLGDEHGLQSFVIRRMASFLAARGKRLIGWDEILEGGLAQGAAVMSWRGTEGGIAAARAGHDAVMSPQTHCYLDYRQAQAGEPKAIGEKVTPLETTYSYEPIPAELTEQQAGHILGVQGNVWTEYMPDMRHVEYMVWPRAAALAEVGWSPGGTKNFDDFRRRAKINEARIGRTNSAFRPIDK